MSLRTITDWLGAYQATPSDENQLRAVRQRADWDTVNRTDAMVSAWAMLALLLSRRRRR